MPYYQWRGVDLDATIQKGARFAQSVQQLTDLLGQQEIYLLEARPKKSAFIFKKITKNDITSFFYQLATLMEAKVHLSDALPLIVERNNNPRFQNMLCLIADQVNNGVSFAKALQSYPSYFSPLVLQLVEVGEESGTVGVSCRIIATHLQEQSALYNTIRSALLLPGLTFACFLAVVIIIFTALIPRFAVTFNALKVPLPHTTQVLLHISSWVTMTSAFALCSIVGLLYLFFYRVVQIPRCRLFFALILLRLPYIGPLMHGRFCISLFQSLSLLLERTIPLDKAVTLLAHSAHNSFLKSEIISIQRAVQSGISLSIALARSPLNLFDNVTIAMTVIGQESCNLVFMLNKITECYTKTLQKRVLIFTTLIQPVLMVVLGLCVALLITLLYIPLFNLSLSAAN